MTAQTTITQAISQAAVDAAKAAVQAMAVAASEGTSGLDVKSGPFICRPTLKQPTFD